MLARFLLILGLEILALVAGVFFDPSWVRANQTWLVIAAAALLIIGTLLDQKKRRAIQTAIHKALSGAAQLSNPEPRTSQPVDSSADRDALISASMVVLDHVKRKERYAADARDPEKRNILSVWFDKVRMGEQRVRYESLKSVEKKFLSMDERLACEAAVAEMDLFDDFNKGVMDHPETFDEERTVNRFLTRTKSAKKALRKLVATLKEAR